MIAEKPAPFIFIHVPKNGGTSIERSFMKIVTGTDKFDDLKDEVRVSLALPAKSAGLQHCKLRWFEQRVSLADYFVFAVVRNPFERAISQIWYLKTNTIDGAALFKYQRWADNLRVLAETHAWVSGQDLGSTQAEYLRTTSGEMGVNLMLRFENLKEDWLKLLAHFHLDAAANPLHWEMKSERLQPYQEFFDDASAELIGAKYRQDLDAFGYGFE